MKGNIHQEKGMEKEKNIMIMEIYDSKVNILMVSWIGLGYDYSGNKDFEIIQGNGLGKEYRFYGGRLKFKGQYLNGLRNGKGREYYFNGNLLFEGEYRNNEREGIGKEYYLDSFLKFAGFFLKG